MHGAEQQLTTVAVGYLRLIVLAPLLGSLFNMTLGRRLSRTAVGTIACASVAVAFAVALRAFFALGDGAALHDLVYAWIHAGAFQADVSFRLDALSAVMCLVVAGVGLLIHIYSTGYMAHDPDHARYFAYLNLFMAAMLTLVLADNVVLMFVGWEGVGLCSYLLIGFWYTDPAKAAAGMKAFIANRVGDAGFLLGIFAIFWGMSDLGSPSLRFAEINAAAATLPHGLTLAAAILLFVGATGKSAQIPLFVWLPDAMAGPTPVSALIHAATMVTAGVYMVARLHALYLAAPLAMWIVAVIGALTAFGAATVGVTQNDIKKVLAYSTISQLGYMFLALGVGAFSAAIFHVMTHAFFKALLFLGAGSVIHSLHEEQDIRRMGGLRAKMPVTYATFGIATLAIAGVPGLSGFFSKDEILAATFDAGSYGLWALGLAGAALTAFYMTRLTVLTFFGDPRGDAERHDHAHESPPSMTVALVVLGALSAIGGYVGVPHALGGHNAIGEYLAPVLGHHALKLGTGTEFLLMAASVGAAVLGIAVGWGMYRGGPQADASLASALNGLYRAAEHSYYVDAFYQRRIVGGIVRGARWLWNVIDVHIIDALANGVASLAALVGSSLRRWSTGNVEQYALTFLMGMVLLIGALMLETLR